jgi:hypothetical protein
MAGKFMLARAISWSADPMTLVRVGLIIVLVAAWLPPVGVGNPQIGTLSKAPSCQDVLDGIVECPASGDLVQFVSDTLWGTQHTCFYVQTYPPPEPPHVGQVPC